MDGDAVESALQRIEAAIGRIERTVSTAHAPDSELRARHQRLREAVAQSLRELDQVIADRSR